MKACVFWIPSPQGTSYIFTSTSPTASRTPANVRRVQDASRKSGYAGLLV